VLSSYFSWLMHSVWRITGSGISITRAQFKVVDP
jgi:hypothetical protein